MNNIYTLKFDVEILSYISNVVENELVDHDKDEKKAFVLKVMKLIFTTITAPEELIIVGQINYLVNNKRIKKISTKKYLYKSIGGWICRRIGWTAVNHFAVNIISHTSAYQSVVNLLVHQFGLKIATIIIILLI